MDHAPHAEIRRIGRWTHAIRIVDGLSVCGPYPGGSWHVLGARRARRLAARQLRRYVTEGARATTPAEIVHLEDA